MERFKYILLLATVFLCSCHQSRNYFPREIEPVQVELIRFDNDLMNVQAATARQDIEYLYEQYPYFMPVWVEQILGIPCQDTAFLAEQLPLFLNDTVYHFRETNQHEKQVMADMRAEEQELSEAFSRVHYLYPDWEIPTLYLFISGFNASIFFVDDETIGIGADMYLGSDYELYNRVVYEYQKQTMRKECIPADVVSAYLFRNIPYTSTQNRLLDQMIYRGKVMYLLSQVFPNQPKWEVMGYTKQQWQWCERNERAIWHLMMDKKDLFKTESLVLTGYLNDGPFTSEISQDAPARLGTWMGWRIAESYMEHNPEVDLQSLMSEPDAQKILEFSYYKP